jgi:hypothetical protein
MASRFLADVGIALGHLRNAKPRTAQRHDVADRFGGGRVFVRQFDAEGLVGQEEIDDLAAAVGENPRQANRALDHLVGEAGFVAFGVDRFVAGEMQGDADGLHLRALDAAAVREKPAAMLAGRRPGGVAGTIEAAFCQTPLHRVPSSGAAGHSAAAPSRSTIAPGDGPL